ncbi:MAG TPA: hypothetical protein VLA12_09280 [Planctomycetaceae bacterium]|nr:hypothetical protein [Planctomycetaceae bacterium]
MKVLLIIAVIVLGLAFVGWLKYSDSEAKTTITIDKQEVKKDTEAAVEKSKEVLNDVQEKTSEVLNGDGEQTEAEIEKVPEDPDEGNKAQDFETLRLQPEQKPIEK